MQLPAQGAPYPPLIVRAMAARWGSTSPRGRITLNPKLVKTPLSYIGYVVYRELCHLVEPHHGPAFYRLLRRLLPDWQERREKLNAHEFG